ncbi:MAG: NUDIX domain-containing protein [Candidatus Altimarinota bacterium]
MKKKEHFIDEVDWKFFLGALQKWYQPKHRKLPWKDIDNAYLVWVSEVFLQQTQADRVVEFFLRFTSRFPTVEDLAKASFEEALPYFKGLGFYGRLRRMLETARAVVEMQRKTKNSKRKKNAEFPTGISELEKLPGIGPYTARAVASFAYKQRVLAPDTNVTRILMRYFGKGAVSGDRGDSGKWIMKNLDWFDEHYPNDFNLNQVLMDFGSKVCGAARPKCGECPLAKACAFAKNPKSQVQNSKRSHRSLRGYKKVVVGILIQGKKILVSRRKADQTYPGLLEFPGGKVEVGEDERRGLQREFREELGIEISVRPPFEKIVQHEKKQVLSFHRCRILTGEIGNKEGDEDLRGMEGQEVMWLDQEEMAKRVKEFLPANKKIIEQLKKSRL